MDISSSAMASMQGAQWKEHVLSGKGGQKEQADQIAREFEGVFIRQFLDKALTPMDGESGLFGGSDSAMYDQLIKDTLASSITQGSSLGFSSVLQAQLFSTDSTLDKGAISK